MSAEDLRKQMKKIQEGMNEYGHYIENYKITTLFLKDINHLNQIYGEFVGKAKAEHREHYNQITSLDNQIIQYFQLIIKVFVIPESCFTLINLSSGKISELISFISTLDTMPPQQKISKASYDKLLRERDELKKTVEIMIQYKGLPELNTLMETAKNNSLQLDEHWVLALCSSNLIEAVVNKKLEQLGEKAEGNFEDRFKQLQNRQRKRRQRHISTSTLSGLQSKEQARPF